MNMSLSDDDLRFAMVQTVIANASPRQLSLLIHGLNSEIQALALANQSGEYSGDISLMSDTLRMYREGMVNKLAPYPQNPLSHGLENTAVNLPDLPFSP